jgi:TRAP-type C4-dicarboxylate transport system permease small subunit
MSLDTQEAQTSIDELAHAFEEGAAAVDLRHYGAEDWITLAVFWAMIGLVFLQFFTRYVLNDSLAWTEEVAVGALVVLVFLGAAMCIRTSRHIQVDVLYHYLPTGPARWMSRAIDLIRIGFFIYALELMWRYVSLVADEPMISVNLTQGWVLYPVLIAFAAMLLRSTQVAVLNWRRGYSVLERPEGLDEEGC